MNPVKDIALALQPLLPASEGWQAAGVVIGIGITAVLVIGAAALGVWIANKMGLIE